MQLDKEGKGFRENLEKQQNHQTKIKSSQQCLMKKNRDDIPMVFQFFPQVKNDYQSKYQ